MSDFNGTGFSLNWIPCCFLIFSSVICLRWAVLPLFVPSCQTFRLAASSVDVIHAVALPGISVKMDAIPARISDQLGIAFASGLYRGQCSELCGSLHGFMPLSVCVV